MRMIRWLRTYRGTTALIAAVAVATALACIAAVAVLSWSRPLPAVLALRPQPDEQVQKDLWWICTPAGWQQIETSSPVHIWAVSFTAPGLHSLAPGPYVRGPFSPADTFTTKWGNYPSAPCGSRP
jgi:hypothetical protein